ncbi:MAG: hypothetical protein J0I09_09500 [Sphingobacteriia bacterium]|nr:hypothetical protein [Sphingobacteriia bacterium]
MEVHHHPHVEKKSFKEYLLEGLMIFIAVSMGFIAENIRENLVNKEKEHHYAESLYTDLKTDEAKLPFLIRWLSKQIKESDSLFVLLNKTPDQNEIKSIYTMFRDLERGLGIELFITNRTITQLNSTGDFRLIKHKNVSDGISDYYKSIDEVSYLQKIAHEIKGSGFQILPSIMSANDYHAVIDSSDNIVTPNYNLRIDLSNKEALNKLLFRVSEIKGISSSIRNEIMEIKTMSTNLRNTVQKEYHLEKE